MGAGIGVAIGMGAGIAAGTVCVWLCIGFAVRVFVLVLERVDRVEDLATDTDPDRAFATPPPPPWPPAPPAPPVATGLDDAVGFAEAAELPPTAEPPAAFPPAALPPTPVAVLTGLAFAVAAPGAMLPPLVVLLLLTLKLEGRKNAPSIAGPAAKPIAVGRLLINPCSVPLPWPYSQ
jgi:hypothetical protein